ncbi:MAG: class II aldolase/adducin family protein [Bacteroides sp.]|nr:class II aldolase/adducin family protein [Bacillota bacterium]MCM1393844.1 class II aldolase/adducin family protein [[Eubacterium] siraeum]MCM1455973.1 class II aldolase/adducin family protein [Bacteroides sp.]
MDSKLIGSISECAKLFSEKKFIESGYIAVRDGDGIAITAQKADLNNIGEKDVVFVNDKNIESFEGNFRAAAVILFCAIRQDKMSEVAAIVDSDAILEYSSKRKPLQAVMDNVAKLLGVTVKCSSKNVAAEIVTSLAGYRNACFMPDAGAVVKARSLKELLKATDVLDKACSAEILAENKGGTAHINPINAFIEQVVYKLTSKEKVEVDKNTQPAEADKNNDGNANQSQSNEVAENIESDEKQNQSNEVAEVAEKQDRDEQQSQSNEVAEVTEKNDSDGQQSQSDEVTNENIESDAQQSQNSEAVAKKITLNGKVVGFACPRYITAVCAIGKPMTVVGDEYKEKLGDEIKCLPSKMILSKKGYEKAAELAGDCKVCLMAQHGAIVKADSEQELYALVELAENACKAHLEEN